MTEQKLRELKVEWTPLIRGGSSFKDRNLLFSTTKIRSVPNIKGTLFLLCFTFSGPLMLLIINSGIIPKQQAQEFNSWWFYLVSFFFFLGGLAWLKSEFSPRSINLKDKKIVIGHEKYDLEHLYALQIVEEKIHSTQKSGDAKRSYTSYELNLVLDSSERFNFADYGNYDEIKMNGEKLSQVLGRPLIENADRVKA